MKVISAVAPTSSMPEHMTCTPTTPASSYWSIALSTHWHMKLMQWYLRYYYLLVLQICRQTRYIGEKALPTSPVLLFPELFNKGV